MSNGWLKMHRELFAKSIWQESTPEQKVVLMTLLSMANYEANGWEFEGERYELQPGQMITSLPSIAQKCGKGISIQNVRTALKRFEKLGFLTGKSTNKNRLITIVNWGLYQGGNEGLTDNLTGNQQATNSYIRNKEIKKKNSPAKAAHDPASDKAEKNAAIYKAIVDYLNEKAGKSFRYTTTETQRLINGRLTDGYTVEDFKHVIDTKVNEWIGKDQEKYLRPNTLFSPGKFEAYLNQSPKMLENVSQSRVVTEEELPDWLLA